MRLVSKWLLSHGIGKGWTIADLSCGYGAFFELADVVVLHPLSYLIKKANFLASQKFFANYKLLEHIVFSSQEFAETSKMAGFPVIVAMYKRAEGEGLVYDDIV